MTGHRALQTQALADLPTWIAPRRTAVLVIDMQVDFASPEGALGRAGVDMSVVQPALGAAARLVAGARKAGMPVIFVGLMTRADTDSRPWMERLRRRGQSPGEVGLCRAGEPGSAFCGPTPEPGELVVPKLRYSAFHGAGLRAALKARAIDTLIVCGLTTECCVDSTVRDAFQLDYHVFVATDACAAYDPEMHAASLKALDLHCAILLDTDQALAALRGG